MKLSKERRDISQRKIRRIKRKSDDTTFQLDTRPKEVKTKGLKPNTKLYYTKVSFGVGSGLISGFAFLLFDFSPPIDIWLLVLIASLLSCLFFVRYILRISPDELDQKRLWLSGTFTFVLLFIVVTSLIWMLPGPRA
ncbi:MAG: hypothetical protein ACFFAJ_16325 [Candidatus Hodarchaeota archaeon]